MLCCSSGQCCRTAELLLIGLVCSTAPAVRFPPATGTLLNKTTSKIKTEMKYFGTFTFTHHPSTCKARGRGSTMETARIKCLNETETEMLPILYITAFLSPICLCRFIRSINFIWKCQKNFLYLHYKTERRCIYIWQEKKNINVFIPIKKKIFGNIKNYL